MLLLAFWMAGHQREAVMAWMQNGEAWIFWGGNVSAFKASIGEEA